MRASVFLLFFCLYCGYCSAAAPAPKTPPKPETTPSAPPPQLFCILGGQSGKPFGDLASFKSVVWKNDIVYAGETADGSKDQQARLEILKTMREARGSKIAVGFDALDSSLQPVLDDYTAGKIPEEEFLQRTGWRSRSGADFALYRPIFDFVIRNGLRALALNVPRELISKIEREGLSGLSDEDKKLLPAQITVSKNKKYLEFLKTSFPGAGAAVEGTPAWENYLAAASSWNEGAGTRIADFVNLNPGWEVLVAAGNARLVYNAALPASVKSRTVKIRQASFYADTAAKCPETLPAAHKDIANYIWYTNGPKKPGPAALPAAASVAPAAAPSPAAGRTISPAAQ
jgi:uncharacterized iron-regulated protein